MKDKTVIYINKKQLTAIKRAEARERMDLARQVESGQLSPAQAQAVTGFIPNPPSWSHTNLTDVLDYMIELGTTPKRHG